jgi:predicted amidohydrolase
MKIGYIQTAPIFGDKDTNFEQINMISSKIKADLLVLPELFATGYNFVSKREINSLAENLNGRTANFLRSLAKKTNSIIIGGYIENHKGNFYNSAMVVSKEGIKGNYRKIHLYYKEKIWFSSGNLPLSIIKFENFNLGLMICFDWFFPETARTLALLGADIIAHPSNLVLPYCQDAMITRCLENKVIAITSNRVGEEKRGDDLYKFTGKSQITSYNGEILSSAPEDESFIDVIEIDLKPLRNKLLNGYNHIFDDRRTDLYKIDSV